MISPKKRNSPTSDQVFQFYEDLVKDLLLKYNRTGIGTAGFLLRKLPGKEHKAYELICRNCGTVPRGPPKFEDLVQPKDRVSKWLKKKGFEFYAIQSKFLNMSWEDFVQIRTKEKLEELGVSGRRSRNLLAEIEKVSGKENDQDSKSEPGQIADVLPKIDSLPKTSKPRRSSLQRSKARVPSVSIIEDFAKLSKLRSSEFKTNHQTERHSAKSNNLLSDLVIISPREADNNWRKAKDDRADSIDKKLDDLIKLSQLFAPNGKAKKDRKVANSRPVRKSRINPNSREIVQTSKKRASRIRNISQTKKENIKRVEPDIKLGPNELNPNDVPKKLINITQLPYSEMKRDWNPNDLSKELINIPYSKKKRKARAKMLSSSELKLLPSSLVSHSSPTAPGPKRLSYTQWSKMKRKAGAKVSTPKGITTNSRRSRAKLRKSLSEGHGPKGKVDINGDRRLSSKFKKGDRVRVYGLRSCPQLNNTGGTIERKTPNGRYIVKLDEMKYPIGIKPSNVAPEFRKVRSSR